MYPRTNGKGFRRQSDQSRTGLHVSPSTAETESVRLYLVVEVPQPGQEGVGEGGKTPGIACFAFGPTKYHAPLLAWYAGISEAND